MGQVTSLKRTSESALATVTLTGVIVPWSGDVEKGPLFDYKLITTQGLEYFILADSEWRATISQFCWENVVVRGIVNFSNKTLLPQKIYPKGPSEAKENVVLRLAKKSKKIAQKIKSNADLYVFVPAAIVAMMI